MTTDNEFRKSDIAEITKNIGKEMLKGEGGLHDLLSGFSKGIPLSRPVELLEMAEKVANQMEKRKEEDIDNWAEELSKEIIIDASGSMRFCRGSAGKYDTQ